MIVYVGEVLPNQHSEYNASVKILSLCREF